MKEKKVRKKQTKVVLAATGVFLVGAFVVSFLSANNAAPNKATPQQYVIEDSSRGISSDELTADSSAKAVRQPAQTDEQVVRSFVKSYLTQPLDAAKLDERASQLKEKCAISVYQNLGIDSTTAQLKTMLAAYQNKQAVSSNSSVRFVSRTLQNVALYEDTADSSRYYVEAQYSESTPGKSGQFDFYESLKVSISNGQVSEVKELDTTPDEGGKS